MRLSRSEFVGPQVGEELAEDGAKALAFVVIGIMIYLAFRFEWKFSVAAIIANLHDVVIILGFFAFFQWEFSLSVLAAVLAVLGYSVNESVVIFDRIRETFRRFRKLNTHEVIDHAITSTISRTIITHGSTQMMVLSMLIFGGQTLHYFAIALTIGILFGIYSSVFVAAAIAMWLGVKREDLVKSAGQGPRSERPERRGGGVESKATFSGRSRATKTPCPPPPTRRHWRSRRGGHMRSGCSAACRPWCRRSTRARELLAAAVAEPAVALKRRELLPIAAARLPGLAARHDDAAARRARRPAPSRRRGSASCRSHGASRRRRKLSLVDDDTIEHEILSSRLALAMMDRASWEFTDLRSRMNMLESREELDANDILRPHVLARIVTSSWLAAPLGFDAWRAAAVGGARGAVAVRRRGVPRDQPLPAAAPRPARGRPAALHPPLEPRRRAAADASGGGGFGTPTGMTPSRPVRIPAVGDAGRARSAKSARRRA